MAAYLVDENLHRSLAPALCGSGIDAEDVRDAGLKGKSDPEVFAYARSSGRVLVTADRGFGNILAYPPGTHAGIVLVRYPYLLPYGSVIRLVVEALKSIPPDDVAGNLVVLEPGCIRIRRKGPVPDL